MLVYFGRIAEEEGGEGVRRAEAVGGGGVRSGGGGWGVGVGGAPPLVPPPPRLSQLQAGAETPGRSAGKKLINEGAGSPASAAINTANIWREEESAARR